MSKSNPKNIVICLDGTGCQFRENNTNVVKLFRVIERTKNIQVAYYSPGVGTLGDPDYKTPIGKQLTRILGLAFGWGIIRNIEEAYSFLMEQYQDGDFIFIFGFSRGAYTARALAAFVHACGLLEPGCQNLIPYAMKLFREKKDKKSQTKKDKKSQREEKWKTLNKFRKTYSRKCTIHFLGLWDSVKTFGWIYDPVFLPFTTKNRSVKCVRHAMAIDERRAFFPIMIWGGALDQDVKQVWFPGCHGDIGGGYPESQSGLSKVSLHWMLEEAHRAGLNIHDKSYRRYILGENTNEYIAPDPLGKIHRSLVGLWWLIQYLPRRDWDVSKKKKLIKFPRKIREIPENSVLHSSVLKRIESSGYRPKNLGLKGCENDFVKDALLAKQYSFEPPLHIINISE